MAKDNKALFLDRDGTLILDKDYLSEPDKVELIPGVVEALQKAVASGYKLFLYSNQSGVGRGYFSMDAVHACNAQMLVLLGMGEDLFCDVCLAPETPEQPQVHRKPSPRFIEEMVEEHALDTEQCYMLGDRISDWQAGINGKITPIALKSGKPFKSETLAFIKEHSVECFDDLLAFSAKL